MRKSANPCVLNTNTVRPYSKKSSRKEMIMKLYEELRFIAFMASMAKDLWKSLTDNVIFASYLT